MPESRVYQSTVLELIELKYDSRTDVPSSEPG